MAGKNETHLKILVKRYLEKKLTDEELEVFVVLMKEGKLDRYIRESMEEQSNEETPGEPYPAGRGKNIPLSRKWLIAASIAAALMFTFYFGYREYSGNNQPVLQAGKNSVTRPVVNSDTIKIYNSGHLIFRNLLPDGSIVWLQPSSSLTYIARFKNHRNVILEGEAFFEVTKDHKHPFVINSGNLITKVWGTSFRIRSFRNEGSSKVSVLTGKVSVRAITGKVSSDGGDEIMLLPEEEVVFRTEIKRFKKEHIAKTSDVDIWRKMPLSFESAPLARIAQQLSAYYHIQIKTADPALGNYQLTADFTNKNLADILLLLCKSLHLTYTVQGNTVILSTEIGPVDTKSS